MNRQVQVARRRPPALATATIGILALRRYIPGEHYPHDTVLRDHNPTPKHPAPRLIALLILVADRSH